MPHPRPSLIALSILLAFGCDGVVTGTASDAGGRDAQLPDSAVLSPDCAEVAPAAEVFATNCAVAGACHVPGGRFPDLSWRGLPALVGAASRREPSETLVVAGDPETSWLVRKMRGTQGAGNGALMPIGTDEPIDGLATIEQWIAGGAPTTCDDPPPQELPSDPNTIPQEELFTCGDPSTSSPARIRRIDRLGWTHATGRQVGSLAHDNPLYTPAGRYSTYSEGLTIDAATLDLYMLVLPQAAQLWRQRDSFPRLFPVYDDREMQCMYNDAAPSDECIDYYLTSLLRAGVLFRTPSPEEFARLREELVNRIAAEGGDASQRPDSLVHVASAAWLMAGALFQPELGEPVEGDALGRRRLTDDELALALGRVLSTHPPGSAVRQSGGDRPGEPDRSAPELGWLGQVRAAADDGTIQDPAVMRTLLATYRGGVDLERADIALDIDSRRITSRGEYFLAGRIGGFFREWLDYEGAASAFKDTPGATSAFEDEDTVGNGFSHVQAGAFPLESHLVEQLDDTIARIVLDAEGGGDVFRALFTSRLWRLPSNLIASSATTCTSDADCTVEPYLSCRPAVNLCSSSVSKASVSIHRVYGITGNIEDTHEARWVDVPEGERSGVLTHPAWLAAHGGNFEDDASAVLRGRWIREHLYCESVPGLDLVRVEAQLVPSAPELRARDRIRVSIEEGENAATCMNCHRQMNSLGYPFEIYNHAGFLRASDHGQAPDGSSTIDSAPDPSLEGSVADAIELSQMLADSPYARRCFVRHVFRYFAGRDETLADACTLTAMETAFAGGSFFDMLEALVTSDTFLYRTLEPEVTP